MRFRGLMLCAMALTQVLSAQTKEENTPRESSSYLFGYTSQSSQKEKQWEQKFRDGIVPDNIRENMKRLSARPHHVGSAYDKDNAEWMLSNFKDWGFDAHIETFQVLFPTPKQRALELLSPTKFTAKLQEPALSVDPTSSQTAEHLP